MDNHSEVPLEFRIKKFVSARPTPLKEISDHFWSTESIGWERTREAVLHAEELGIVTVDRTKKNHWRWEVSSV